MTVLLLRNSSTMRMNGTHSSLAITSLNLAIGCFIFVSFLVGIAVNGLFFWVLAMKIKRTVNTLWYLHLTLSYFISCGCLPFIAVGNFGSNWIFGLVMCKVIVTFFSLGLLSTVFLLTIISLDHFLLICHPVWSQHNRTIPHAWRLITGMWVVSLSLNIPSLIFLDTQEVEKGRTNCALNFALSSDWDGAQTQVLRDHIHLAFFIVHFLMVFFLPFLIIAGCYYWMAQEMKKRRLVKTGKPFKVLVATVVSFFICRLPTHFYYG